MKLPKILWNVTSRRPSFARNSYTTLSHSYICQPSAHLLGECSTLSWKVNLAQKAKAILYREEQQAVNQTQKATMPQDTNRGRGKASGKTFDHTIHLEPRLLLPIGAIFTQPYHGNCLHFLKMQQSRDSPGCALSSCIHAHAGSTPASQLQPVLPKLNESRTDNCKKTVRASLPD